MKFKEIRQAPLVGALNTHIFVEDENGKKYLRRHPKSNLHVMSFIAHEQDFIGFTGIGGKFRRRTPQEQERFTINAVSHGLRVLPPTYVDEKGIVYFSYLSHIQTLDNYLPNTIADESQRVVLQLFNDLQLAHSKGVIYGDRWSENMLIVPTYGLMHIDFDLEIYGNGARELEVAQVVFYTLCGGREKVLPLLANLLGMRNQWFDLRLVEQFTMRLATHFQAHKTYGNAVNDSAILFDIIRAQRGLAAQPRFERG